MTDGKGTLVAIGSKLGNPHDTTAAEFKESKNSNETGTSLKVDLGVDFGDGQWHCGTDKK